jgi:hypothetical protein
MPKDERSLRQRLTHGAFGAFAAAFAAVCVQIWILDINWWFVGICALFGFVFAWLIGEDSWTRRASCEPPSLRAIWASVAA